jgi:hypothetical protein
MYLFACRIRTKIKIKISTSNCKILYLTILVLCRKNLSKSDRMDCKIITIEGGKSFFGGVPGLLSMF